MTHADCGQTGKLNKAINGDKISLERISEEAQTDGQRWVDLSENSETNKVDAW